MRLLGFAFVGMTAIMAQETIAVPACPPTTRVSMLADGSLLIDGKVGSVKGLDTVLASLGQKGGRVWYYREQAGSEPSPELSAKIKDILDVIIRHQLPVSLSTKPDFSDSIDESGHSHPRASC
jgi:hypothetical protein